ncbi:uncharacterized protein LOC116853724 [Odontomachus brunneus]|uniref:uncharacterized protein LOC116853724 n=1 Tax=Odontomachus brunneus TaxID=486640 RepID=UPI0013F2A003|nr:uncharacterized protein LOC116853724 [Odontomachus brunneus]
MDQADVQETRRDGQHVNSVVFAPTFLLNEPEFWFAVFENQFTLHGITQDSTKYAHVLSQLNAKYAREAKDATMNSSDTERYIAARMALIQQALQEEQRIRQLLEHKEVGDRKPSQFQHHLHSLTKNTPEALLRKLWLDRLPVQALTRSPSCAIAGNSSHTSTGPTRGYREASRSNTGLSSWEVTKVASISAERRILSRQLNKLVLHAFEFDRLLKQPQQHSHQCNRSQERKKQPDVYYYHRQAKEPLSPHYINENKENGEPRLNARQRRTLRRLEKNV